MLIPKTMTKLEFFKELYQKARSAQGSRYDAFREYNEQYEGSGMMFSTPGASSANFIWNITREIIDSKRSVTIPSAKVTASKWSTKGDRNARAIERLCGRLRNALPFERLNDLDESYTYIDGGSVWLIEWDESIKTHATVGDVKITVVDPDDFTPQPNVYNVEEMEYCFIRFLTSRDELVRRYGISRELAEQAEAELETLEAPDDEDSVTVYTCFWRDEEDKVCLFSWSDEIVLQDLDDYYSRRRSVCRVCGRREELCTCESPELVDEPSGEEELDHDILIPLGQDREEIIPQATPVRKSDGSYVMEKKTVPLEVQGESVVGEDGLPIMTEIQDKKMAPTCLPYYVPKRLPIVIRRNIFKRNSLFGQSDCAVIRPQQETVNKINTRIMEKILRSGVMPVLPEDARVSPDNSIFEQVIRLAPGENSKMYGTVDTQVNIAQDWQERQNQYMIAKRNVGITESYQGNVDHSATSGVAKQAAIAQSAGRLSPHRQQKAFAYSEIDRIIFEYYLAYADEPRPIAYRDAFGRIQHETFNRYAFYEYDEETGEWYIDDGYIFSADENGDVEQQREAMWELNLNNLRSGALGDPANPATLLRYWQSQEREHYPHARENVEYFENMVQQQQAAAVNTPAANIPTTEGSPNV